MPTTVFQETNKNLKKCCKFPTFKPLVLGVANLLGSPRLRRPRRVTSASWDPLPGAPAHAPCSPSASPAASDPGGAENHRTTGATPWEWSKTLGSPELSIYLSIHPSIHIYNIYAMNRAKFLHCCGSPNRSFLRCSPVVSAASKRSMAMCMVCGISSLGKSQGSPRGHRVTPWCEHRWK